MPWQLVEPNGKSGDAYSSSSDWSSTHVFLCATTGTSPMVALVLFAKDGGQVLPSGIRGVNRLRSHRVKTMSVALAAKMGLNHSS